MARKKTSDVLRIGVTFPRPDGPGPVQWGARMNSSLAAGFRPAHEVMGKALEELVRCGFQVTTQGRLTCSIRGTRRNFEKTFGTKLSRISMPSDETAHYSADSVYYPGPGAPWNPRPQLKELIDDAYIQWPHIYMNQLFNPPPSPLPPRIGYHHLRVPGDVVMLLSAAKVQRAGVTGKGVRVVMVDSGFAHGHPYFQQMGYNTATVLAPGATQREEDGNGHGTGESANLLAIAPDVTFIGVKLDNEEDPDAGASLLEGFQEALTHNPDIVSVSLGFDLVEPDSGRKPQSSLPNGQVALEAEVAQAVADGVIVVFSAGNGHVSFPGMMPDVISSGGVYVDEQGGMQASSYSSAFASQIYPGRNVPDFCGLVGLIGNRAEYIMLPVPPGSQIDRVRGENDGTGKEDGWGVFSGTSAAAPQLAGICALLLQKNPHLTPGDIKAVLRRTCRDVSQGAAHPASNQFNALAAGPGIDAATGAGLVDAFAAFSQV
ncbi:MAG: S8 family serine peptidase [Acidobacteriota bacterium]